jgi:hypothetical protein
MKRPNPCNAKQYFKWLWEKDKTEIRTDADLKRLVKRFFNYGLKWAESKAER